MKGYSIRLFIGVAFSAIGAASLFLTKEILTSAIWLSFGNGLILTDYKFKRQDAQGNVSFAPVPKARFYTGLFLIVFAVLLLFFQIYLDMQQVK